MAIERYKITLRIYPFDMKKKNDHIDILIIKKNGHFFIYVHFLKESNFLRSPERSIYSARRHCEPVHKS